MMLTRCVKHGPLLGHTPNSLVGDEARFSGHRSRSGHTHRMNHTKNSGNAADGAASHSGVRALGRNDSPGGAARAATEAAAGAATAPCCVAPRAGPSAGTGTAVEGTHAARRHKGAPHSLHGVPHLHPHARGEHVAREGARRGRGLPEPLLKELGDEAHRLGGIFPPSVLGKGGG